ncbi:MAG: GDSL-type esterase/lipase family protein [Verrucomicrobiae bacterium]|nr:GDSL-type esterase/lipase family protein [Verrucomicrobiae bacterium]
MKRDFVRMCGWLAVLVVAGALLGAADEAVLRNPNVMRGLEITTQGAAVVVAPGECRIGGRTVAVASSAKLAVEPAPIIAVANEPITLSADKPAGWSKGTRLRGCNARDVNACGAFVPGSLEIRRAKDGELLKEGKDYLLDSDWGHVGLGPNSRVTTQDAVLASYRYSLLRMDTIQIAADGKVSLKSGEPHISAPVPPGTDAGALALAHVFVSYRAREVPQDHIYPILETPQEAVTRTTPGRVPRTLAKLQAGDAVRIVCWGDSVTAGGNASKPELRYVDVFAAGLRARFPKAKIDVQNISAGGSNSRQWLYPDKFPYRGKPWQETGVAWQRIADAKPDLVTLEFVNDAGMAPATVEAVYSDILRRVRNLGAELILITPHFTMWRMMGFKTMREPERRPYVLALREFAEKHHVALADASARWEHLWKEGLPYLTLLHNTINHPDDRGHRLFAEELWKCFQEK